MSIDWSKVQVVWPEAMVQVEEAYVDVMDCGDVVSLESIASRSFNMDLDEAIDFDEFWDTRQCRDEILMGWC